MLSRAVGVAGALRRGANGPINDGAMSKGPVEPGEVAVTDADDPDADYVIHAAAMPHYGDGQATRESIRAATHDALTTADELGCDEIRAYDPASLSDVRVIAYSPEACETVQSLAV